MKFWRRSSYEILEKVIYAGKFKNAYEGIQKMHVKRLSGISWRIVYN